MAAQARTSRESVEGAGWTCANPGEFRTLIPPGSRPFSWLPWAQPRTLLDSRNDKLAEWLGDPTNDQRQRWVAARLEEGTSADFVIDRNDLESPSLLLVGDPGEGDASQYAVVPPLLSVGQGTDFMVIASDVIYPAGEIDHYPERFFRPYKDYARPIYALPGNHDWYDGLEGFMRVFCDTSPPAASEPRAKVFSREWLRRLLWRQPSAPDEERLAAGRALRSKPEQQASQPGPYWALDTSLVRFVGIDTGIAGLVDGDQGEWLRRVSRESDKPKVLITGKPIYVDGRRRRRPIEGGGTVDDVVRDPENRYVAAIGGDIHNYQRYPVRLEDGRVIQYLVAGGGGAFMHATHKIPKVDLPGCSEEDFRCYPLRGDSLSFYSLAYDRRLGGGHGKLFVPPAEAAALIAERLGITPTRGGAGQAKPSPRARRAAAFVFPLPGRGRGIWHAFFSEFFDWNEPPMFKSFLRLDVEGDRLRVRCFGATGCGEHEASPPAEDDFSIPL